MGRTSREPKSRRAKRGTEKREADYRHSDAETTVEDAKKAAHTALAQAKAAAEKLKRLGKPFLDWAGKAERLSFDVPTLPLFVHERLSTKAILETLKGHERDRQMEMQLFADPQLPLHQQLEAYEH